MVRTFVTAHREAKPTLVIDAPTSRPLCCTETSMGSTSVTCSFGPSLMPNRSCSHTSGLGAHQGTVRLVSREGEVGQDRRS